MTVEIPELLCSIHFGLGFAAAYTPMALINIIILLQRRSH